MSDDIREKLARTLCGADGKVNWTEHIPAKYYDLADALLPLLARACDEGYNLAVHDHTAREDGAPYCWWPTSPNPYWAALNAEAKRRHAKAAEAGES